MTKNLEKVMKDQEHTFQPISIESLKVGAPAPCRLFIHLQSNNRYVPIANEWQILDVSILDKVNKVGAVYTSAPSLEETFPAINESAQYIKAQLAETDLPTFQRAAQIRQNLSWLEQHVFQFLDPNIPGDSRIPHLTAVPHIIFRALEVPRTDLMVSISDFSLPLFRKSLDIASTTCLLAMWLGYCEKDLLISLTNAVFCSEVGLFSDSLTFSQEKQALGSLDDSSDDSGIKQQYSIFDEETFRLRYQQTIAKLKAEPLFQSLVLDHRLTCIIAHQSQPSGIGDPLFDILLLARWFYKMAQGQVIDLPWHLRSFTKLIDALDLQIFQEDEVA